MNHTVLVSVGESRCGLPQVLECLLDLERTCFAQDLSQAATLDEGHGEEGQAVALIDSEDRQDVGVAELPGCARLLLEASHDLRVLAEQRG